MKSVYTEYFQKSKVFLYPLLRLKKGIDYVPAETYCFWDEIYDHTDYKFICLYKTKYNTSFQDFQIKHLPLLNNKMEHYDLGEEQIIIFDMKDFRHDYDKFIEGRYSAFGVDSKIAILDYFGGQGKISSYVQSFLSPDEDLHKLYSEFFNVDFELIQEVHELCSAPDKIKETLYYSYPMKIDLHNFKNSLSLGK
tara:strand:+ start:908 stop:1489 length:582 start_codon:yes stop_codon:yes gene_type:complete